MSATRSPRVSPICAATTRRRRAQLVELRVGQRCSMFGEGRHAPVGHHGFFDQDLERSIAVGSMSAGTPAG